MVCDSDAVRQRSFKEGCVTLSALSTVYRGRSGSRRHCVCRHNLSTAATGIVVSQQENDSNGAAAFADNAPCSEWTAAFEAQKGHRRTYLSMAEMSTICSTQMLPAALQEEQLEHEIAVRRQFSQAELGGPTRRQPKLVQTPTALWLRQKRRFLWRCVCSFLAGLQT